MQLFFGVERIVHLIGISWAVFRCRVPIIHQIDTTEIRIAIIEPVIDGQGSRYSGSRSVRYIRTDVYVNR